MTISGYKTILNTALVKKFDSYWLPPCPLSNFKAYYFPLELLTVNTKESEELYVKQKPNYSFSHLELEREIRNLLSELIEILEDHTIDIKTLEINENFIRSHGISLRKYYSKPGTALLCMQIYKSIIINACKDYSGVAIFKFDEKHVSANYLNGKLKIKRPTLIEEYDANCLTKGAPLSIAEKEWEKIFNEKFLIFCGPIYPYPFNAREIFYFPKKLAHLVLGEKKNAWEEFKKTISDGKKKSLSGGEIGVIEQDKLYFASGINTILRDKEGELPSDYSSFSPRGLIDYYSNIQLFLDKDEATFALALYREMFRNCLIEQNLTSCSF